MSFFEQSFLASDSTDEKIHGEWVCGRRGAKKEPGHGKRDRSEEHLPVPLVKITNCSLEQSEVAKEWKWKVPGAATKKWKAHWHTTHRHRGRLPGPRGTGISTCEVLFGSCTGVCVAVEFLLVHPISRRFHEGRIIFLLLK